MADLKSPAPSRSHGGPLESAFQDFEAGNVDAALDAARAGVTKWPKDSRPLALLGLCLAKKGDAVGAISALRKSLALETRELGHVLALAELVAARGETNEAIALANYVLLKERDRPELRAQAQALKSSLAAHAPGDAR